MQTVEQMGIVRIEGSQGLQLLRSMQLPLRLGGVEAVLLAAKSGNGLQGIAVAWPTSKVAIGTVKVAPPFRNRGIGGSMLQALEERLRIAGCMRLRTQSAVAATAAAWLKRRRFTVCATMPEFEHDSATALKILAPLWQRMQLRVPADAEMLSYRQACARGLLPELARVDAAAVGGEAAMIAMQIERAVAKNHVSGPDPDHSLVIVRHNELVGLLRCRYLAGLHYWFIDSIVVAPPYRNGWANVWLRHESHSRRLQDGRSRLTRFRARDDQHDTRRYAEHFGARLVHELELLEKSI